MRARPPARARTHRSPHLTLLCKYIVLSFRHNKNRYSSTGCAVSGLMLGRGLLSGTLAGRIRRSGTWKTLLDAVCSFDGIVLAPPLNNPPMCVCVRMLPLNCPNCSVIFEPPPCPKNTHTRKCTRKLSLSPSHLPTLSLYIHKTVVKIYCACISFVVFAFCGVV